MSFRNRLILALLLLLVPLVAGDFYYRYRQYSTRSAEAVVQHTRTASDLSRSTELFVSRTIAVQRAVGLAIDLPHWQHPTARATYIASELEAIPVLTDIALVAPDGRVIQRVPASTGPSDIASRPYFRHILSGADWAVSGFEETRSKEHGDFIIATAIRGAGGELLSVVASEVDGARLAQALGVSTMNQDRLVLIDTNGYAVVLNPARELGPGDHRWGRYAFVRGALRGNVEHVDDFDLPGEPSLTGALVPVTMTGWAAGAFVPRNELFGPVRQAAARDSIITLFILILAVVLATLLARQVVGPVVELSRAAQRLGRGDWRTRARESSIAEFATLARTMNTMADSLQERDEALRQALARERRISTAFQERMLPEVPARVGRTRIATSYFPALEEAELGGDFYDVMLLPNGLVGLVMADVSGKGLTAAVHTAMAKYMLEGFVHENSDPADALTRANAALAWYAPEYTFVTVFLAILDPTTGEMTYANAGHPQPILRHADGSSEWLAVASGPPIGAVRGSSYTVDRVSLADGDTMMCYTDGVIEARNGYQWFGLEGLQSLVESADVPPGEMVDLVYRAVAQFGSGRVADDIALLAIRFEGDTGEPTDHQ